MNVLLKVISQNHREGDKLTNQSNQSDQKIFQ